MLFIRWYGGVHIGIGDVVYMLVLWCTCCCGGVHVNVGGVNVGCGTRWCGATGDIH